MFAPSGAGAPKCPQCGFEAQGQASTPSFSQGGAPGSPAPYPAAPPGAAPTAPGHTGFQSAGQPSTHWASVTALILGILGFVGWFPLAFTGVGVLFMPLFGVGAIIFGAVGISAANSDPSNVGGKGMAVAGLVMGIVQLGLFLVGFLFVFFILREIFREFLVLTWLAGL